MDELKKSRRETRASFENRALVYAHLFETLAGEFGEDRAAELMREAIRARGLEVGEKYRAAGEAGDLEEVGRLFCETSPCAGTLFEPAIEESGEGRIVLSMRQCPLVDAWRAAGKTDAEVDRLCWIASAVDEGTFERAGLELEFLERAASPGASRCLLELKVPTRRR